MNNKIYYTDEILNQFPLGDFGPDSFVGSDNYSEEKLFEKLKSFAVEEVGQLQQSAIFIAIMGAGKEDIGSLRFNNDILIIKEIFMKCGVKQNNTKLSLIKDDDLTARRLVRLFRAHTKVFIEKYDKPSYLWRKYSPLEEKYKSVCFPGAEHLIEEKDQFIYLLEAYKNLDTAHDSTFCVRICRVGVARGILTWKEAEPYNKFQMKDDN